MTAAPVIMPLETDESSMRMERKLRRELGEDVIKAITHPDTEDLCLNPDGRLWIHRAGRPFECLGSMSPINARAAMATIASYRDTVHTHDKPVLETKLPFFGCRFEGLIPPIVSAPAFALRTHGAEARTIEQYESAGILTNKGDPQNVKRKKESFLSELRGKTHGDVLRWAAANRQNVLVVGATGSGKTSLTNAVLDLMARSSPNDRILAVEDTPELICNVENFVPLLAVGNISMLDCFRVAMRMVPKRIVVGEVRGGEALELIKSWNTGHPGGIATVHADDALSALSRIESLVAEVSAVPQQSLIAKAINVVVFIEGDPGLAMGRKVKEVCMVLGHDERGYQVDYL